MKVGRAEGIVGAGEAGADGVAGVLAGKEKLHLILLNAGLDSSRIECYIVKKRNFRQLHERVRTAGGGGVARPESHEGRAGLKHLRAPIQ